MQGLRGPWPQEQGLGMMHPTPTGRGPHCVASITSPPVYVSASSNPSSLPRGGFSFV